MARKRMATRHGRSLRPKGVASMSRARGTRAYGAKKFAGRAARLEAKLDENFDRIWREFGRRIDNEAYKRPFERAVGYLQVEIYKLVKDISSSTQMHDLEDVCLSYMQRPPKTKFEDNAFIWVFAAIKRHGNFSLSDDTMNRYGIMLNYANKHGVPSELLIGFLHQAGGWEGIKTQISNFMVEEWYKPDCQWILEKWQRDIL